MSGKEDHWEFYRDARSKWRWRRVAANGRIVSASSQGYSSSNACVNNAQRCGYMPPEKWEPEETWLPLMAHFQPRSVLQIQGGEPDFAENQ